MRKREMVHGSGMFEDLFAERQVYLRSGLTSRYVVLSRSLQIGVTIAMGLIIAGLAYASYSAITKHFELAGQSRELARLEDANQSLRAAAKAAPSTADLRAQAARVPELTSALSAAEAARKRAEDLSKSATAQVDQLRQQLAAAQDRIHQLTASSPPSGQTAGADGATATGASEASDRLAKAQAQIEKLSQALDQQRAEGKTLSAQLADARSSAEQRIAEATKRAEASDAEVAGLRADLDAARKDAAALRQSAQTAEANLADLRAEVTSLRAQASAGGAAQDLAAAKQPATEDVDKLKATLASAQTRIAELTADLEAAKRPAAAQASGPAPAAGANGQSVADLQQQLDAANQKIAELQAAIQSSVANLAPLPPPPAPR
jgi:chromosome segregation ATPase